MHAKPCATTPPGAGPSVPGAAPGEGRPSRAARVASTKARTSAVTSDAVTSSVQLPVVCQTPHRSWKRWTPWVCSVSRAYGCRRHRPCRPVCSRRVRTTSSWKRRGRVRAVLGHGHVRGSDPTRTLGSLCTVGTDGRRPACRAGGACRTARRPGGRYRPGRRPRSTAGPLCMVGGCPLSRRAADRLITLASGVPRSGLVRCS